MSVTFDNTVVSADPRDRLGLLEKDIYVVNADGKLVVCRNKYENDYIHNTDTTNEEHALFDRSIEKMQNVIMVDSGKNFVVAVCENGTLWTWSKNLQFLEEAGEYGLDILCRPIVPITMPANVPGVVCKSVFDGELVVHVHCGLRSFIVLTNTGRVWFVDAGLLTTHPIRIEEVRFPNQKKISMVAMSYKNCHPGRHFVALDIDGGVWTWGYGRCGQLGLGWNSRDTYPNPIPVPASAFGNEGVVMIAAGQASTAAVTKSRRLYTWGMQYGTPNYVVPTLIPGWERKKVRSISCANFHMLIVTEDGFAWTLSCKDDIQRFLKTRWNQNNLLSGEWDTDPEFIPTGPTRLPKRIPSTFFNGAKIVACKAGVTSSAVVTELGDLYVWGAAVNTNTPNFVPLTHSPDSKETVRTWSIDFNSPELHDIVPERAIAVLQALHPRLGKDSEFKHVPPDLLKRFCTCDDNQRMYHGVKMMTNGDAFPPH